MSGPFSFVTMSSEHRTASMRLLGHILGKVDHSMDELEADPKYIYVLLREVENELLAAMPGL